MKVPKLLLKLFTFNQSFIMFQLQLEYQSEIRIYSCWFLKLLIGN